MTVQTGCQYVLSHKNPLRPDHIEYCGKWVVPDTKFCADHQKTPVKAPGHSEDSFPARDPPSAVSPFRIPKRSRALCTRRRTKTLTR